MKYFYGRDEIERTMRSGWLTDREGQVAELYFRRGWRIDEIAAKLYTSRSTINRDLKRVRLMIENDT